MAPLIIACSNCKGELTVPPQVLGKLVRCPLCKIIFTAPLSENTPAPLSNDLGNRPTRQPPPLNPPFKMEAVPSVRKPFDDDDDLPRRRRSRDDDDDDYDRRSRSGSWYGRSGDRYYDRIRRGDSFMDIAEASVAGPAVCTIIIGVVFMLFGMFFLFSTFGRNVPQSARVDGLAWMVVTLCWGGFIVAGGVMMKNLRSYGMAMTAAVMLCINWPCFIIHLVIAVWSFVVLNKPEVKQAFRWKANQK